MKKIILLSGIIIATLVSCSPEDLSTYEQKSNKTTLSKESASDFCTTCRGRDSIITVNVTDSIASDPLKPKKD